MTRNLTHVTLTGVDDQTNLPALLALSAQYPMSEWGILYSVRSAGYWPRYPARELISKIASYLHAGGARLALHICGGEARQECDRGLLRDFAWPFQRVQINGKLTAAEVERACAYWPDKTIITQDNGHGTLWQDVQAPNHAILMDSSGGRGIEPTGWRRQPTEKPCGFAGGLGPLNLAIQLPRIRLVARGEWWVDMENNLRHAGADRFVPELARQALWAVDQWYWQQPTENAEEANLHE